MLMTMFHAIIVDDYIVVLRSEGITDVNAELL